MNITKKTIIGSLATLATVVGCGSEPRPVPATPEYVTNVTDAEDIQSPVKNEEPSPNETVPTERTPVEYSTDITTYANSYNQTEGLEAVHLFDVTADDAPLAVSGNSLNGVTKETFRDIISDQMSQLSVTDPIHAADHIVSNLLDCKANFYPFHILTPMDSYGVIVAYLKDCKSPSRDPIADYNTVAIYGGLTSQSGVLVPANLTQQLYDKMMELLPKNRPFAPAFPEVKE